MKSPDEEVITWKRFPGGWRILVCWQAIIGSDNILLPVLRQANIRTNDGECELLICPLGPNLSEIWIKYDYFQSRKLIWKHGLQNGGHFVSSWMSYWIRHMNISPCTGNAANANVEIEIKNF